MEMILVIMEVRAVSIIRMELTVVRVSMVSVDHHVKLLLVLRILV